MIGALGVDQFTFEIEPFASKAVKSLIFTEINVTLIVNFLQYLFNNSNMRFVRCADKMIVFNAQIGPEIFKELTDFIDIGSGAEVFLFGCTNDLVPMFIRAG